jgi:hypothetical protein
MKAQLISLGFGPLVRFSFEESRYVEYLRPNPSLVRMIGMETKQKGSDQPPTQVGLDDQRTEKHKTQDKKSGITDKVMEEQAKEHQVQRT